MNAKWLIDEGVSPSHILTETASWEVLIPFPSQSPLSFPLLRVIDLPLICILQPHFYHHSYLFSFFNSLFHFHLILHPTSDSLLNLVSSRPLATLISRASCTSITSGHRALR